MYSLLFLLGAIFVVQSLPLDEALFEEQFEDFTKTFEKKYTSPIEYKNRLEIFTKNVKMINEHNAKGLSWTMGITQFADWNEEEIRGYLLPKEFMNEMNTSMFEKITIPEGEMKVSSSRDWRDQGVIGNVKNQGQCGSCWAFATIAPIEAQWAILGHGRQVYSEQQLVDCDPKPAAFGCKGGYVDKALIWSQVNGNAHDGDYPYQARQGNCQRPRTERIVEKVFVAGNYATMVNLVDRGGPMAFTMWVPSSFAHYTGGVYEANGNDCSPDHGAGAHAMAIIGYGNENGRDFWLVRNSWGSRWGDQGYIKIRRGVNTCSMESWGPLWPKCHGMNIKGTTMDFEKKKSKIQKFKKLSYFFALSAIDY